MRALLLPLLLIVSCCATGRQSQALVAPTFSAQDFFAGRTRGDGELKIIFSRRRAVRVDGTGRPDASGGIVLNQVVTQEGKPPEKREWRIREASPGHYIGTLSDAVGPVTGDVTGNRLHLYFYLKGGLRADQVLDLSPDRQSARNVLTVRKFGVVVATLHETIRKVGS